MASIYRHEYRSSGLYYRIDFIQRGATAVNEEDVAVLPPAALKGGPIVSWTWDQYPIGIHAPVRADVSFEIDAMPTELKSWVLKPHGVGPEIELVVGDPDTVIQPTISTIMRVWMKVDVDDEWRVCWYGVVNSAEPIRPDEGAVTVPFIDALMESMKALSWSAMKWADFYYLADILTGDDNVIINPQGVVEWVWRNGNAWSYVCNVCTGDNGQDEQNSNLWGVKWHLLVDRWNTYVQQIFTVLTRGGTRDVDITAPLLALATGLRKQSYSDVPTPGSSIDDDDIWFFPFTTTDQIDTADLSFAVHTDLGRDGRTFWDTFVDATKQSWRRCSIRYLSISDGASQQVRVDASLILSELNAGIATGANFNLFDPRVGAIKISPFDRLLGKGSTASEFNERHDISSFTPPTLFGRNDGEFTIPVTFRNDPVGTDYRIEYGRNGVTDRAGLYIGIRLGAGGENTFLNGKSASAFVPRLNGFYYKDNPSFVHSSTTYNAFESGNKFGYIRCHSWHPLADAVEPSPSPGMFVDWTLPMGSFTAALLNAVIEIDQSTWGIMARLAERMTSRMASLGSATLTCEVTPDVVTHNQTGLGNPVPRTMAFTPHVKALDLDPADVKSYYEGEGLPTVWYPTSCKFDMSTDKVELEGWGL